MWVVRQFLPFALQYLVATNNTAPVVLEPSAGDGRIIKTLMGEVAPILPNATWLGVDIHDAGEYPAPILTYTRTDYLRWEPPLTCDFIITNPPFSRAEQFIRRSMEFLEFGGVLALLLRLGFLSSSGRANGLWKDHPLAHLHILPHRPCFTHGNSSDKSDYAWYIWKKGFTGTTQMSWLPTIPVAQRRGAGNR
jgi:hypothetical protein